MSSPDVVIRSRRVVTPDAIRSAAVHLRDGVIDAIAPYEGVGTASALIDIGEAVLMPGLVDTHVHVNEPGRTEWEGFAAATRAAAAGGVTTLLDMPLNSVPATTTRAALDAKREAAEGQCWVDVGFLGGVVPGNTAELRPLFRRGVFAFKCFLVHSGVDEFANVSECDLRLAMPELARLGATLMVHAELPGPIDSARQVPTGAAVGPPPDEPTGEGARVPHAVAFDPRRYESYLRSRPRSAENEAVALMIQLCRELGTRVHIVHLSSSDALPLLRAARADGLPISAETCPHYLHFAAEEISAGATPFKCAPPIRECANREALWRALGEGLTDMVVSDHSPCPPAMKATDSGDFFRAWGGIASLQLGLSVIWTEASRRDHSVRDVARWMSERPAHLAGLGRRKGAIAVGHDADFVVWDPDGEITVDPATLHHRHKLTPYAGERLRGLVLQTWLRGERVYDRSALAPRPTGRVLTRSAGAEP